MGRDERSRPAPAIDTLRFERRTRWVANFRGMFLAPAQSFQPSTPSGSIVRVPPPRRATFASCGSSAFFVAGVLRRVRSLLPEDRMTVRQRAHTAASAQVLGTSRRTHSTPRRSGVLKDQRGHAPVHAADKPRGAKKRTRAKWPAHLAISSLVSWTPTQRPSS